MLIRLNRLRWVAYALVLSGLFRAVYGSLMTLSGLEYGFFQEKVYGLGLATGTFIYRNHFAGYLEMCLSVGIGLLIAQLGKCYSADTWRQRIQVVLAWILSPKMVLRLSLVLMVIALVLSRSRMGNTAFFTSILVAGIIGLILSRQASRATVILLVSLIVIDIFIVGIWFGVDKVAQRIEETRLVTETRDEVNIYTIPYWQDFFWTGSGLGSYYTTFPHYQGSDLTNYYDHAHNDYLEFAAETGIVGLLLLGIAVLLTLGVVLSALHRRRSSINRGMAFGVTMAITALLIHSTVDFNLQIPANAATFMLILALGWVAAYLPRSTATVSNNCLPSSQLAKRLQVAGKSVMVILMGALLYLITLAGSRGEADLIARQVRESMKKWPQQEIALSDWTNVHDATIYALQRAPNHPGLLMTMGHVYYWQGTKIAESPEEKLAAFELALKVYLAAVKGNPTNPLIWDNILLFKHRYLKQYDQQFWAAFYYAAKYGPWEPHAQRTIIEVGLAAWYQLPSRVRLIVIGTIERGMLTQAGQVKQLIKHHRRQWQVCAYANDKAEQLSQFCQMDKP